MSRYDFDKIFEKLDILYDVVKNNEDNRDLINDIMCEVDDALFTLQYDLDEKEKEIELLREQLFESKGYRF